MGCELDISLEPDGWQRHVDENGSDFQVTWITQIAREAHKAGFLWALRCLWQRYDPETVPFKCDVYTPIEFLVEGEWVDVSINAEWDEDGVTFTDGDDESRRESFVPWEDVQEIRIQRDLPKPEKLFPPEPKSESTGARQ